MSAAHILGFPRMGAQRELKFALEKYWREGMTAQAESALRDTGRQLRAAHWQVQRDAGLAFVTVGDFAWYDQVLSTLAQVGGLPKRFGFDAAQLSLTQFFAMARGNAEQPAMEMTKWFDTNYHYLVPEFSADMAFGAGSDWLFDEIAEARAAGHAVKPALVGPLTLLWLGKERDGLADRLSLLPGLLGAYARILARLKEQGIEWVQMDEPIFALDLPQAWRTAAQPAYEQLAAGAPRLLLATYFDDVSEHAALLKALPVAGLHIDLARAPRQLEVFLRD
jgi:5-methyltetrahydropteroyltriglutamate--homocysteine methyltransferase